MNNILKRLKWDSIVTAVLGIIVGIVFIITPKTSADILCTVCGIMLIAAGIIAAIVFFCYGRMLGGYSLALGVAMLISGIFCLIYPSAVQGILTFIVGIFIVIDAGTSFADSIICARARITGWPVMLLTSLLMVVLGCIVMFGTFDMIIVFAGWALIINGACDIIMTLIFSHRINEAKKVLYDTQNDKN